VIHQPPYSLLNRQVEADLLPLCEKEAIAAAPYQVLQGGLLTGKYRRGQAPSPDSRKAEKQEWVWDLTESLFDRLEEIENEARASGRSMLQHALQSALEQPAVVSLVVGAKRVDQLESLISAVGGGSHEL